MKILVQKFGGTSVGSIDRIRCVADTIINAKQKGYALVIVVSAMAGETDRLINLAKELVLDPDGREYDVLVSVGEQITMSLLAMTLIARGYSARSYNGRQAGIHTDNTHKKAQILHVDTQSMQSDLQAGHIIIVAGFQGVNDRHEVTTLGRGGSDTTAVALAAALQAEECQIYTDVDGVYTADPRTVPAAKLLTHITFEEMLEMSDLGAKVLQNRAVRYAGKYKVPLRVLSSFTQQPGTLITYEEKSMEKAIVSGIAFNRSEAKITIFGVPQTDDVTLQILGPIADAHIDVDMIVQNTAENAMVDLTFTVNREEYQRAMAIVERIAKQLAAREVMGNNKIAKLSVIGVGMRSHSGVAKTMFSTLAKEGIKLSLITTSEIKISVVIDEKYLELAARSLHSAFALDNDMQEEFDPITLSEIE